MKRLLSILLSVMLLLGSISITAFASADVNSFALVTTGQLSAVAGNSYVLADSYVMFTAVEGATYYNGNALAEQGAVMKSGTVSLKVNAGNNVFTARNGDEVSAPVYVYGASVTASTLTSKEFAAGDTDTVKGYIAAYKDSTNEDEIAKYNFAKALFEYDEQTDTYGRTVTQSESSASTLNSSSWFTNATYAGQRDYFTTKFDFYVNGGIANDNGRIVLHRSMPNASSGSTKYFHLVENADGTLTVKSGNSSLSGTSVDFGLSLAPNTWHTIEIGLDHNTKGTDIYVDGVLVVKGYNQIDPLNGYRFFCPGKDANVYISNYKYTSDTAYYAKKPALTATFDDVNDQITVQGTDLDQFSGYDVKIFVEGEPTTDTVTLGTATNITVGTAVEGAEVYAALVDANNNILTGLAPIKSNAGTMSISAADIIEPLDLTLTTDDSYLKYTANGAADNVVIAGSKVLFNEIELSSATTDTVKYYNNDREVTTTEGPIANTVAITVNEGVNSITAKRVNASGVPVSGTESNAVVLVGKSSLDVNGSLARKGNIYNTITDEAVLSTLPSYSNTVYQCKTGNFINATEHDGFFADPEYDYAKMDIDVYYTLVGEKINGDTGYYTIIGVTSARSSGVPTYLYINDDGTVAMGSSDAKTNTAAIAEAGVWNSFEFCVKDNGLVDIYMNDVLIIKNFLREDLGSTPYTTGLYFRTANASVSNASNKVYLGNIDLGLCWYPITANLSTGSVKIPVSNYTNKIANNEEVAVLGRKADGTVDVVKYTHTGAETTQELPGTSYEKIFVWTWDDLTPLCDAIQ